MIGWPPRKTRGLTGVWVAVAALATAQPAGAGTLLGHVTSGGLSVPGAVVAVVGPPASSAVVTGKSGAYSLVVPRGHYRVSASAPGYATAVVDDVRTGATTVKDLALPPSQSPLATVRLYGGGDSVAADGKPGVFYVAGRNVNQIYRSTDWGGTWTQVGLIQDDPAGGLPDAAAPAQLVTSGYPGEVAVVLGSDLSTTGVFYSTDFGTTWNLLNLPASPQPAQWSIQWGHAGTRSVMLLTQQSANQLSVYSADMTALVPSLVKMTKPYSQPRESAVVADGVDQPWIAVGNQSAGTVSVFPLIAGPTAPPAVATASGFASPGLSNLPELGFGGASSPGHPPSGIYFAGLYESAMSVKAPDALTYSPPVRAASQGPCRSASTAALPRYAPPVLTPNTGGSYGAAWADGCWVQYAGSGLAITPADGAGAAIDHGYEATRTSSGTDAVVLLAPTSSAINGISGSPGVKKLAASDSGAPVPSTDPRVEAQPGTDPSATGIAEQGITATTVHQTTFSLQTPLETASATDVGGIASDDGGLSFHRASYLFEVSADWWQGASGSWLLFGGAGGQTTIAHNSNLLTGFQNWSSSTPPVIGGNVSGSSSQELGLRGVAVASPNVDAIAGVPGADMAFVGTSIDVGNNGSCTCEEGNVQRVTLGPGPAVAQVSPIGKDEITKPGPLAYCGAGPSTPALADILLVIAADYKGGALYRVTGATGANPVVTKMADLPGYGSGVGQPTLQVDCPTGTVIAGSGAAGAGLLRSVDGGQTFGPLSVPAPAGGQETIRAASFGPQGPSTVLVGDTGGYIQRSGDGGRSWSVVNDPGAGVNLSAAANQSSHGIWDLASFPGSPGSAARQDAVAASRPVFVSGPGQYRGALLSAPKPSYPVIESFRLSHARFRTAGGRSRGGLPRATSFLYNLSEPGIATVFFSRAVPGRRAGRSCVPISGHRTRRSQCLAYRFVPAALVLRSKQGRNRVAFVGKVGRVMLRPGRYLAAIVARTANGRAFPARKATFTIVSPTARR